MGTMSLTQAVSIHAHNHGFPAHGETEFVQQGERQMTHKELERMMDQKYMELI
jgi:hypothetical protein